MSTSRFVSAALVLLVLLAAFQIADASSSLEGRVLWNSVCPGYSSLGHSKVVLDDGRYSGGIQRDGSFSIPDVDEGSYILNVISHDIMFDSFRVDVHAPGESLPDVRPYVQGTPHNPPSTITLQYPIALTPRQKANYFVEPQSFNALGMLQNPMVLMMLVMGVLVIGLPYLIKNLDPEVAKELNERQSRVSGIQNSIQSGDSRSGLSALLAENEPDASNISSTQSSPSPKQQVGGGSSRARGGKGGRRR